MAMGSTLNLSLASLNVDRLYQNSATVSVASLFNGKVYTQANDAEKRAELKPNGPGMRIRVFLTVCVYFMYFGSGLHVGILGPTLVHLQHLYNTSISGLSFLFVGTNVGYLIGTAICSVVFDRFNAELQFCLWTLFSGVLVAALPWMPHLSQFIVLIALQHMAGGVYYPAGQPYLIDLWHQTNHHRSVLQASYVMYCLGNFIVPFVALPFLESLPDTASCCKEDSNSNLTAFDTITGQNFSSLVVEDGAQYNHTVRSTQSHGDVTKVRYAFMIVGFVLTLSSILYAIAFIMNGPSCKSHTRKSPPIADKINSVQKNLPQDAVNSSVQKKAKRRFFVLKWTCVLMVVLFVGMFMSYFCALAQYISAFVQTQLHWSPGRAALLNSVFYGFHTLGGVIAVFLSIILHPSKLLTLTQICTIGAICLLFYGSAKGIYGLVWASVAGIGAFTAPILPSVFLWLAGHIQVDSTIGGLLMAGSSVGAGISLPIVGNLFDEISPMCIVHISLSASVASFFILIVIFIMGKITDNVKNQFKLEG